ncbi:hypothetical protein IAR55_007069 [Kwoniella newhampshirensis]|uniref:25S rRNA adenine-N(1) methyltransferase n=1 Tax=Kwoniella newhampshirensis TaxID=1651941 RepID=A0AAW0YSE5_9TREE
MRAKRRSKKAPLTKSVAGPTKAAVSHKLTQATIASYHTLLKRQAILRRDLAAAKGNSESRQIQQSLDRIDHELESLGGLEAYQRASKLGQSRERGGDTSKILIKWLEEMGMDKSGRLRMLELGALTPSNYGGCSAWIDNSPIDLHSQHPDILEQDFFQRPLPSTEDEAFDIISCSLVLNFVSDPQGRGRMLRLIHAQLKPRSDSLLFLVLPLPCLANSRYISISSCVALMRCVGFHLVKEQWKDGGKVGYWLWRWHQPGEEGVERWRRKVIDQDGPKKNNFAITLRDHVDPNTSQSSTVLQPFTLLFGFLALALSWITYRCYREDIRLSGAWGCEMSWMMPSYTPVEWLDKPSRRYSLYLYREQGWDFENTVNGHPVIFVPGNAGSYQQVRSIASSASRQYYGKPGGRAEGQERAKKLDFFTVDLNEELSAFDAGTLRDQADFLLQCIYRVLREYQHLDIADRPRQVTLLAHSMGGIVSRLAVDSSVADMVDVIFTMSSPHLIPPLSLEYDMDRIYHSVNVEPKTTRRPLLVSLCGGISDEQVVSDSCALSSTIITPADGLAVFTTGIPGVWTGIDHQAMVWCHQIRWRVAKVLLEMTTSKERADKLSIARTWLLDDDLSHPSTNALSDWRSLPMTYPNVTLLGQPGRAQDIQLKQCDRDNKCKRVSSAHLTLPRPANPDAPFPLPGEGNKPDETMFAVDVSATEPLETLLVDSTTTDWLVMGVRKTYSVQGTAWTSFGKCKGRRPLLRHVTSAGDTVATFESRFHSVTSEPIRLHSHTASAPFLPEGSIAGELVLEIYQMPECSIDQILVSTEISSVLAKIVSRYRMTVIAWPIAWVAVVIMWQMTKLMTSGHFTSFGSALEQVARRWMPLVTAGLMLGASLHCIARVPGSQTMFLGTFQAVYLPLIILFAGWSFGFLCLIWTVLEATLRLSSGISTALRTSNDDNTKIINEETNALGVLIPSALVSILVYLLVPHQLAFVISFAVLWTSVTVFRARPSPIVSEIRRNRVLILKPSSVDMSTTVVLLMLLMLPFKATALLVWARSLWTKWSHPFATDHNLFQIVPAILTVALLSQGAIPKKRDLRTWLLPPLVNLVLVFIAGILW